MARRGKKEGSIYKREDIWYIDVRANGRRIRKRVGTSKKVAELALRDAEVKIARDEFGFGSKYNSSCVISPNSLHKFTFYKVFLFLLYHFHHFCKGIIILFPSDHGMPTNSYGSTGF